jgi:hypothetical protein
MRFFPFTLFRVRMTIGLWQQVASPLCGDEINVVAQFIGQMSLINQATTKIEAEELYGGELFHHLHSLSYLSSPEASLRLSRERG